MKVRRVLEIKGPAEWVTATLENSWIQPEIPYVIAYEHSPPELARSIREVERIVLEP